MHLSYAKHYWSPSTVCTKHVSVVLMVLSSETFWNVFGPVYQTVLINHPMHCTFSCGFMASEMMIHTVGQLTFVCCSIRQTPTGKAVKQIDVDILQCTWIELEYHLETAFVTNGAHG
jgi:hypothetical protein